MKSNKNTIILGAGLAGLSAAYHGNGIIFEKESYVGGMCHSPKVKGFTFDYGIHVLHSKNAYVLKLLQEDLKVKLPTRSRQAWIFSHGAYTRYPMQANTYGLPAHIIKRCLLDFIKVNNNKKIKFKNYKEWLLSAFGEGFAKSFLIPYSEKFWTVSARKMTTDWLDIRIPKPTLEEVIEGALSDQTKGFGPNAIFRYPRGKQGIGKLPESFKKALASRSVPIFFNKEVIKVDTDNKKISFKDGASRNYLKLISTIPLPELIKIIQPSPPPGVLRAAGALKYNSIICVNLAVKVENINSNHWIYYPEEDYCFFRISFLKNFSSGLVPKKMSSITAEVSYSHNINLSKNDIATKTIKDLIKAKIIHSANDVNFTDVRDIKYAYVIYDQKRKKNVNTIKKYLSKLNIFLAGRYGSWEYQWMDDAILDGKRAIEQADTAK
tara:strand:- start:64 stop:1371 length:1308 start_codon:yes stop_codon:yes gene_type:complete